MKRKKTANQRVDILYTVIIDLVMIIAAMTLNNYGGNPFYILLFTPTASWLPWIIRSHRQFKKIQQLKDILDVDLSEMQNVTGASREELEVWEKKKYYLTHPQMYVLEDYMDRKFEEIFGHPYIYKKKSAKTSTY